MKKTIITLATVVATIVLTMSIGTAALAADFTGHWAEAQMQEAADRGWITADTDGNFNPNQEITRADAAQIFWSVLGKPAPKGANVFEDVAADAIYRDAVIALSEMNIISGTGSGKFNPNSTLTRETFCTMATRVFSLTAQKADAYKQYADADKISDWARDGMSAMAEAGYVKGKGDNMSAPQDIMTRAEMVTVTLNVFTGERATASFEIHKFAKLTDIPDLYWVGTSGDDGKLNGYKLIVPKDMTINITPVRASHTFNVWHDGKKINTGKINAKFGDEIALEIVVANPNGTSLWFKGELPQKITATEFDKWYTKLGGISAYAGGYSTIPKWDTVKNVKVAGLDASLVTLSGGDKAIRFTADKDMSVTRTKTVTEINIWLAPDKGDWTTLEPGKALNIKKGDLIVFEIKAWEKAVLTGDVIILPR